MGDDDQGVSWGPVEPLGYGSSEHQGKFSSTTSGHALTVMFDNLRLDLQGTPAALSGLTSFAFKSQFDLPFRRGLVGFKGALRGSIGKSEDARVAVIIAFGNSTKVLDFPYGESRPPDSSSDLAIGPQGLFSIEDWLSEPEAGGVPRPRPPLIVSITLLAQRKTTNDDLLAQIDALDVFAVSYDGGGSRPGDDAQV
jgi:hypothetical protein